jgi:hypothetical protein
MKKLDLLFGTLLVIGGLNWGLVGLLDINLVDIMFGEMSMISRSIYMLVGFAALYDIFAIKAIWKRWNLHFKKAMPA